MNKGEIPIHYRAAEAFVAAQRSPEADDIEKVDAWAGFVVAATVAWEDAGKPGISPRSLASEALCYAGADEGQIEPFLTRMAERRVSNRATHRAALRGSIPGLRCDHKGNQSFDPDEFRAKFLRD